MTDSLYRKTKMERLGRAIVEAERFVAAAKSAQQGFRRGNYQDEYYSPHFAAAKRASMDLSRALSDLRRTTY